jgi:hypothetical protein
VSELLSDPAGDEKMDKWCRHAKSDGRVQQWLKSNPPPPEWLAGGWTPEQWAYTEMPQFPETDLFDG